MASELGGQIMDELNNAMKSLRPTTSCEHATSAQQHLENDQVPCKI